MSNPVSVETVILNNGVHLPRIGLGVYQAHAGQEAQRAVREALRIGYRHIDTAHIYGNERDVGTAILESGIPRSEVFVTTKLWNDHQGYDSALRAFDDSLSRLGLGYVDLYLIHWPVPQKRQESWRALERILNDGKARAIGVSNYMTHHLNELLDFAEVLPAVNQIEVSPFLHQHDVRALCAHHGIVVEAYSPLTRATRLDHPVLRRVAERVRRSPAQVLLRWALQNDLVVLPKAVQPVHIAENASIFDFSLDAESMHALEELDEGFTTGWDPRKLP